MTEFAEVTIGPGGVLAWIGVGLIAGWLMGSILSGGGLGIEADLALGLIGAFVGGIFASYLIAGEVGFWVSLVVAALGGCVLIAMVRIFVPAKHRIDSIQ